MSRALTTLFHADVVSTPVKGWAGNGTRKVSCVVVVKHGNAKYPKPPQWYTLEFYGAAAEGMVDLIDQGKFDKKSSLSVVGRTKGHRIFTNKHTGEPDVNTIVTVLDNELVKWWAAETPDPES